MNTPKAEQDIIALYQDQNKSTYEIAELFNTYPNKIRRILKKHGCALKTRGEAQKNGLQTGRINHPTMGKTRSQQEKVKISAGMVNYWENLDDEEKERRSKAAKQRWDEIPEEQKDRIRQLAIENIQKAGKEGSKIEKTILKSLTDHGFRVEFHKKNLIQNEKLEIDLYLPELKTIIEVDGPSHFLPVWGEEKLQKQIKADMQKSGLILGKGFIIIRVKVLGFISLKKQEDGILEIINCLKKIKVSFPPRSERYIEVEI